MDLYDPEQVDHLEVEEDDEDEEEVEDGCKFKFKVLLKFLAHE